MLEINHGVVSVIMPVFNGERFITQAIESVLAQTYTHWELITIDDGSTDNTSTSITQFSDPRIRYIYQENKGLAGARNAGITMAQGVYLAFLDADDEWEPEFLAHCVYLLASDHTLAGVYTLNHHIDEKGLRLPIPGGQIIPPEALYSQLLRGGFFPPCAIVVKTSIVREVGLFDTGLHGQGTEDWDLWLHIARCYPLRGINAPLALYRVRPGSMSTNAAKMHQNRIAVLTKHLGLPESNPETWNSVKRQAYGFAYRQTALGYIMQGETDEGWRYLAQAAAIYPDILCQLDTFYELAFGNQPRGYRGQPDRLNLEAVAVGIQQRLDTLLTAAPPDVQKHRSDAYSNAHLVLTMLYEQSGDWTKARRHLYQSLKYMPTLLKSPSVVRQLVKLHLGQSITRLLRDNYRQEVDKL